MNHLDRRTVRVVLLNGVLACCVLAAPAGCGGRPTAKMVPVRGKATLNGKPLADGMVTFIPTGGDGNDPLPEGKIEPGGFYTLTTRGSEGAPVGSYRAVIELDDKATASLMHPDFANPKKSPLLIEVAENKPEGGYDLKALSRR
jgi:hypothetical protein